MNRENGAEETALSTELTIDNRSEIVATCWRGLMDEMPSNGRNAMKMDVKMDENASEYLTVHGTLPSTNAVIIMINCPT